MVCQICGAKSGFYPLCKACFPLKDEGKISKCEECGIWKKDTKPLCYECWLKKEDELKKSPETEKDNFRTKCPGTKRADDGHFVRSKAELLIDNWLFRNNIIHVYEKRVPIEEEVYCDFFIPICNVWIEFWGLEDKKYIKRKEAKKKLYELYGKKLIELTDKDIARLDDIMQIKLRPFLPKTINFD